MIPTNFRVRDMGDVCKRCEHYRDKRSVGNCFKFKIKYLGWIEPYFATCDEFKRKGVPEHDKDPSVN